jgi:hypothetical protein
VANWTWELRSRDGGMNGLECALAPTAGGYSPITLLELSGGGLRRAEIWPDESHLGLPVLLPGGEVGVLTAWQHAPDRSWWRWSVEFSNHVGRPADWQPDGQRLQR